MPDGQISLDEYAHSIEFLLSQVRTFFSGAMGWAGSVGDSIVGSPLLLTFTVVPLVGLGVGLFKRMINIR